MILHAQVTEDGTLNAQIPGKEGAHFHRASYEQCEYRLQRIHRGSLCKSAADCQPSLPISGPHLRRNSNHAARQPGSWPCDGRHTDNHLTRTLISTFSLDAPRYIKTDFTAGTDGVTEYRITQYLSDTIRFVGRGFKREDMFYFNPVLSPHDMGNVADPARTGIGDE